MPKMGEKKRSGEVPVPRDEEDVLDESEEPGEFEGTVLDAEGCGRQHGRRRVTRGLEDRESGDLPDEPPPGYPG